MLLSVILTYWVTYLLHLMDFEISDNWLWEMKNNRLLAHKVLSRRILLKKAYAESIKMLFLLLLLGEKELVQVQWKMCHIDNSWTTFITINPGPAIQRVKKSKHSKYIVTSITQNKHIVTSVAPCQTVQMLGHAEDTFPALGMQPHGFFKIQPSQAWGTSTWTPTGMVPMELQAP